MRNKEKVLSTISIVFAVITNIILFVLMYLAITCFKGVETTQFKVLTISLCALFIVDIITFVGYITKDNKLNSTVIAISIIVSIVSLTSVKTLNNVKDILDVTLDKYKQATAVFIIHDKKQKYYYLGNLKDKQIRLGVVTEEKEGSTKVALDALDKNNVDYGLIEYSSIEECLVGLRDDECEVAALPDNYKELVADTSIYQEMEEDIRQFDTVTARVNVNKDTEEKDISKEPFNVLLMGYSRTDIGSTVGLTDAIIVATVNPQTYTISLVSIPRDSFVQIPCYNNQKMKINAGREESIECFVDTVEALLGMQIDLYIESDYDGIVNIVDTIGGVKINNPVTFNLDGVDVYEGSYYATGMQVLEFCRERHSMPNGDFDRQQHQRETVFEIVKELIRADNVALTLKCLDAASDYINTNLTYKQICQIYDLVKNTKNWTGLSRYHLIDFHNLRITGYASWHYSDKYKMDLWIYRLYQGSVNECVEHINYVLGNNVDTKDQVTSMTFSMNKPYERELFYHTKFDEKQIHDKYD